MSILGKISVSDSHTHLYTCPDNKRVVATLIVANIHDSQITSTVSLRDASELQVDTISVVNGGTQFTTWPTLTISMGSGDVPVRALAEVSTMQLESFNLLSGTLGYNVGNVLTLDAPTGVTPYSAPTITVTTVDGDGAITGFTISNKGTFGTLVDTSEDVTFTGGTGTGAAIDSSTAKYGIKSISVTDKGDDYTVNDNVTVGVSPVIDGNTVELTANMISDSITDFDAIDFNAPIPVGGSMERTPIILSAGDTIYVKSSTASVTNAILMGVEEVA